MKQLLIDRSRWRTGGMKWDDVHGETRLLNKKDNMCCLGFYCKQLGGLKDDDIMGIGEPAELFYEHIDIEVNEYVEKMIVESDYKGPVNSEFTREAIHLNDAEKLTNEQREEAIREHFKQIDVEVVFEGDYKS